MPVVLVVHDVPAGVARLGQVIEQFLLPRAERVKAGHLVGEYLDIGEAIDDVIEVVRGGRLRVAPKGNPRRGRRRGAGLLRIEFRWRGRWLRRGRWS